MTALENIKEGVLLDAEECIVERMANGSVSIRRDWGCVARMWRNFLEFLKV